MDFTPLYPRYIWIPAFAGMTEFVAGSKSASAGMTEESVRLRRTEGLGVSPNLSTIPHEWGTKGVEENS